MLRSIAERRGIRDVLAFEPTAILWAAVNSGRESSAYLPLAFAFAFGATAAVLLTAGLTAAGLVPMFLATVGWTAAFGLLAAACVAGFLLVEGIVLAPQMAYARFAFPLEHSLNQSGANLQ